MRPLLATALCLAVLLSGCAGSDEAPSLGEQAARVIDTGPTAEELARMPGSIEGIVHTVALTPIADASVRLVRENLTTTTDAGGFFRFASLATTSYLIEASAEGYHTRTIVASAHNGTIVDVNITLEEAVVEAPHHQSRELQGFLSCGARAVAPTGQEHGTDCAAADPNHRDRFEFDVDAGAKRVVLELAWDTEATPTLPRLRLLVETVGYGAMDEVFGVESGEGYVRLVVPQEKMEKYYPEGGRLRASVTMAPDETTPPAEAAAQARFTLYVTTFYVEPGPEDFTVLGGGA